MARSQFENDSISSLLNDKKKSDNEGSIVVSHERLPKVPTSSLDQSLIGLIAGAQFSSVNGTPGTPTNIQLRGINSISGGTLPIVYLDGVQLGPTQLNALDLSSVKYVEIVHGAAAGALYGYQGANGVINIYTKEGESNKLSINTSSSASQNMFINLGGLGKAQLHNFQTDLSGNLIDKNGNPILLNASTLLYSGDVLYSPLDPNGVANKPYKNSFTYYDHFKQFLRPSNSTVNNISISGRGKKINGMFSFSTNRMENGFSNDGYNSKNNLSLNLGISFSERLSIRTISQVVWTKNTINYFDQSAFFGLLNSRPFVDYSERDMGENYGLYYGPAGGPNGSNPNYVSQYSGRVYNQTDFIQNFQATYRLSDHIMLDGKYGINSMQGDENITISDQSANQNEIANSRFLSIYKGTPTGEKVENQVNYVFKNSLINANVVFDFIKDFNIKAPIKSTTDLRAEWRTLDNRSNTINFIGSLQGGSRWVKTNSLLIHQRFEYHRWLSISAALRKDYFSISGRQFDAFPHGAAYVTLSEMSFWKRLKVVNSLQLKLRGAIGKAGVPLITSPNSPSLVITQGAAVGPVPNFEYSIEKEAGIDILMGRHRNRWLVNSTFSLMWWTKQTPSSYFTIPYNSTSGIGPITSVMALGSKGFQFSFVTSVYRANKITWDFSTYFNSQSSRINSINSSLARLPLSSSAGTNTVTLQTGDGIGQIYGYKFLTKVDQKDETGNYYIPEADQPNYQVASNGYVISSATKQPVSTAPMYSSLGNSLPKFNLSFVNEIKLYATLSFSFQFDWVYKSHLYNQTKEWMYRDGIHSDYNKVLTINNSSEAWVAFYRGVYVAGGNNSQSSYFYENASFLRLRNISFKFDLTKYLSIKPLSKFQLSISGRNIWTLTRYTGMDPEINSGALQSTWDRGIDNNTLPNIKSYTVSLDLGF